MEHRQALVVGMFQCVAAGLAAGLATSLALAAVVLLVMALGA